MEGTDLPLINRRKTECASSSHDGLRKYLKISDRLYHFDRCPERGDDRHFAADRATTILTAIDDRTPEDLVSPGHIFPLRAHKGGCLVRTGQTEGSVDLARLAGLKPAGVICEVMKDDGTMARMPDLQIFAKEHG